MSIFDKRLGTEDRFNSESTKPITERVDAPEYRPASSKIPTKIMEMFAENGYHLRWIRFLIEGKLDTKNLREYMRSNRGYTFVRPEEIDQVDLFELGDSSPINDQLGEGVVSGDLVLMKTPMEKHIAYRKYMNDRNKQTEDAVRQRLAENQIRNDSRTVMRTGKNAHFSGV